MRIRERQRNERDARRNRRHSPRRPSQAARVWVESLEARSLLAVTAPLGAVGAQIELEPNDTLDVAQDLGDLNTQAGSLVAGTIGNGATGAADVDWFRFTLTAPAHVSLALQPREASPLSGLLSLYDDDPLDFMDQYDPLGHRLLVQQAGGPGTGPRIERDLGPGTYELAVSGAGNRDFHPFLAGSGFAAETGDYLLQLGAEALPFGAGDGPAVLASDPAPGAVLDSSPFVIRLDLSSALDPMTVVTGQSVSLTYNPSGNFGDGNDQDVALAWTNVGVNGTEIQLAPATPLAPGAYRVTLAGNATGGAVVLADPNGTPLGANANAPQGRDYVETFVVSGIEGNTGPGAGADDNVAGAHDLGDLSRSTIVRVAGAIGDDPYYTDIFDPALNPGNDVDFYHFRITGPGRYAFLAEVFAGRIGSPLDPGISLFRLDPDDQRLHFLAGNNNTINSANATDFTAPLSLDAMITQGLTAGDYYIAVAGGFNTTSPDESQAEGTPGLFDPNSSHSGQNGFSTGPYVLNLLVYPTPDPPQVVSSSLGEGAVLDQPLTRFTVGFSAPVNLRPLAYQHYIQTSDCGIPSVYIQGADGTHYYPRLDGDDAAANQVTLVMLDRLPAGNYTLHLSGPRGLTDLGGNPLVGNDPSGDYVIHFTVGATSLVHTDASGQCLVIDAQPGPDGSQDLGVLFPRELQAGITLDHVPAADAGQAAEGTGQEYRFTLLQDQRYFITLDGPDLPVGARITLRDQTGKSVALGLRGAGKTLLAQLAPGSYVLTVAGVTSDTAYQLNFKTFSQADNPVPLLAGPAPALQLHFNVITTPDPSGGSSQPGGDSNGGTPGSNGGDPGSNGGNTGTGGGAGGVPPVLFGPSPFDPKGQTGTSTTPTGSGSTGGIPVVTVTLPSTLPGAGGGPTSGEAGGSTEGGGRVVKAVTNTVSANLSPTDYAPLAVSPVGGVTGSGNGVGAAQVVQVALQTQGNPPVPMGLVSLVTLTHVGESEIGDEIHPATPEEDPAPDVIAAETTPAPIENPTPTAEAAALAPVDPPGGLDAVLRRIAAWWAGSPNPRADGAGAGAGIGDDEALAEPPVTVMAGMGMSVAEHLGESELGEGTRAVVHQPWFYLVTVLTVASAALRRRRLNRRRSSGRRGDGGHSPRSLFRLWGLHAAPAHRHAAHAGWVHEGAISRRSSGARPRHLTNP